MSSDRRSGVSLRHVALLAHRYVGLAIAAFLLVAGTTGSIIAFDSELDALLNPELFRVAAPNSEANALDPIVLGEQAEAQLPGLKVRDFNLYAEPGSSAMFWSSQGQVFIDPYTAKVLGSRNWGELSEGRKNLIPFIYRLHFSLGLGEVGTVVFGAVALLWTLDCFVGAYLTFPARSPNRARRKPGVWLKGWLKIWLVQTGKLFTFIFTWHRASGLWLWGLFLVFAWSGVALNIGPQVYEPVMSTVFGKELSFWDTLPKLDPPRTEPELSPREARAVGRRLAAAEASTRGFEVLGERYLSYAPEHGAYVYTVDSTLDISGRLADTEIAFDGNSGALLGFDAPTGQHLGGSIRSWLIALHFGEVRVGGLGYRIFVSGAGLMVALLSASGVIVWWRKRNKARRAAAR